MRIAIVFKFGQLKVGTSDVKKTRWWTGRQILHYELLPTGQTITGDLYSQQLERVQQALRQKKPELLNRKGVLFLHDNARPHVARVVRDTIQQLGWEILYHHLTMRQPITTYSTPWIIIFMENPSPMKQT